MFLNHRYLRAIVFFAIIGIPSLAFVGNSDSEKNNIKISFRSQSHQKINVDNFKLNHPIKISQEEITNHLISLRYKDTFLGSKSESVFLPSEIKRFSSILTQAFTRVTPGKVIHFKLNSKGGVTSGNIFSFNQYLNWRFDTIQGDSFFKKNDVRDANTFAWNLTPENGQRFFKSRSDKRIHKNWVVSSLKLPVANSNQVNMSSHGVGPDSSNIKIDPKLEAKLKHLKYLHSKKLINDEEYKDQQKKLFDELF